MLCSPRYFRHHPRLPMDPLSDVLSLLKPRIQGAACLDMGGHWSMQFPHYRGIKCYAIVSGTCWLAMEGHAEAIALNAGDCFLLFDGRPFRLTNDLNLTSSQFPACSSTGAIQTIGGGGSCFIVGGHFALANSQAAALLGSLSPVVHIRSEPDKAALRWALERMRKELSEQQPGASLIMQHLAHMMLIQALRLHVADNSRAGAGWLFALADRQVSAAINAVHADPAHRWTLQSLAERAGMSRSGFALKFKQLVGESPMGYVTRWRMLLASDRLANSDEPVAVLAASLGYESESSFSTAFKRVMGSSPKRFFSRHGAAAEVMTEEPSMQR